MPEKNRIVCADCVKWLNKAAEKEGPFADLIFADPPFNIGYDYKGQYHDKRPYNDYVDWTEQWMTACQKALKPAGSFYIAIGDDYAAEVKIIGRKLGLTVRNWIIWYYTFGQATQRKFARAHTHIFYFVADEKKFTFNADPVRVISDRMREYNDPRAWKHGKGKLPDDVWLQFPRVCGTFREREGWHTAQMPEALLSRIIRASSNPGDLVLDPFSGSGVTAVVAKKLMRCYLTIDTSRAFIQQAKERLSKIKPGDEITGLERSRWTSGAKEVLKATYQDMEVPTDQLDNTEGLLGVFTNQFNIRTGAEFQPRDVLKKLDDLRKRGQLPRIRQFVQESPDKKRRTRRQRQSPL